MGTATRRKDLYLLPSLKSAWPMHRILVSFSFSFSKFKKKTLYFPQKGVSPVSLHFLVFRHRHYWTYSLNGKHVSGRWCCSSVSVLCTRPLKARNFQIQRHLLTSPHTHTACLCWQWQILHLNRKPTSASSREGSTLLINLPRSIVWTFIYSLSNISKRSVLTYAHRLGMSDSMSFWGKLMF